MDPMLGVPVGIVLVVVVLRLLGGRSSRILQENQAHQEQLRARQEQLLAKYGSQDLVDQIMRNEIWQGQTQEQLQDSLGQPVDVDRKVLKSKVKEVWKYNPRGRNRFGVKVTVENGVVVGWELKS